MKTSFLEIFTLIAILHCFLLSLIILFSKFFRNTNNKYLGFTLLIIAIVGLNNWFWDLGIDFPIINLIDLLLLQFLYPLTYFIFFYKASSSFSIRPINLKILIAPFLVLSLLNIIVSLSTIFDVYRLPKIIEDNIPFFYKSVSFLSIFFSLAMVVLSYRYTFLKKSKLNEKWLRYLWIIFSVILGYGMLLETYRFIYSEKLPLTYLWTLSSVLIYWLIYKGLFQFKLSNDQYEIRTILKKSKDKPIGSKDSESPHFQKLLALLEDNKIHHNPNLSRDTVAEQLDISSGYLSQVIKENASVSFSDFIISHRIKDVKKMIKDPDFDKYSLLSIGLECGFNSKTSFFTNFKKETGLTPKEFRKT